MSGRRSSRQRWLRATVYAIVVVTIVGMIAAMTASAFAAPLASLHASHGGERRSSVEPVSVEADSLVPVVLLATTDMSWADVTSEYGDVSDGAGDAVAHHLSSASLMRALAAGGAPAHLLTRTAGDHTCPADAWLTLGAGARTRAVDDSACSWPGQWTHAADVAAHAGYGAQPGALAQAMNDAGLGVLAVGPGAQLALTDAHGHAPATVHSVEEALAVGLPALTVIDVDADTLPAVVTALADSGLPCRLVVASLTDPATSGPQALVLPAGTYGWGDGQAQVPTSPGTHQQGFVQLTDLAPTVLTALGVPVPRMMTGRALRMPASPTVLSDVVADASVERAGSDTAAVSPVLAHLVDSSLRSRASHATTVPGGVLIVVSSLTLLLTAAVIVRGQHGRRYLHGLGVGATLIGALPLGAWLGSVVPWWRVGADGDTPSALTVAAGMGVMVLSALVSVAVLHGLGSVIMSWRDRRLAARTWRPRAIGEPHSGRSPLGVHGLCLPPPSKIPTPLFLTAYLLTVCVAAVIFLDGASGARWGFNGILGMDAVLAGRFYGMSNTAFALASAAFLVAVAAGVSPFVRAQPTRRLQRTAAFVGVWAAGVMALAADGLPMTGADVGGSITLVAALAALSAALAGGRIGWKRWLAVAACALSVVGLAGLIDRSLGSHTHLGRFVGQLQDGTASTTIVRKMTAIVIPFVTHPLAVAALVVGVLLIAGTAWWLRRQWIAWEAGTSPYRFLTLPEVQHVSVGGECAGKVSVAACDNAVSGSHMSRSHAHTAEATDAAAGVELAPALCQTPHANRVSLLPRWTIPALKALAALIVVEVLVNDSGASMAVLSTAGAAPLMLALIAARLQARVHAPHSAISSSSNDVAGR